MIKKPYKSSKKLENLTDLNMKHRKNSHTSQKSYESLKSTSVSDISEKQRDYILDENGMAYILTQKYNQFEPRNSLLDDTSSNSRLNKSILKGIHNLCSVFGFIILLTYPIKRYQKTGQLLNPNLINNFSNDFIVCSISWPLFYIWSYTALLLQKLIIKGLNRKIAHLINLIILLVPFLYTMHMVYRSSWCTSHVGYISMLTCTHTMKMYSYYRINMYYREDTFDSNEKDALPVSPYPNNITFSNFTLYMWMPVLVYEHSYPRNEKIRYKFLFWKLTQTIIGIFIAYQVVSDHIMPQVSKGDSISIIELLIRLILPILILTLAIFYLIWEGICNVFAEITRFADRRFYDDWWNSTTYEEFNRKWNRSVYNFLFRHVYLESIYKYKLQKKNAQLLTFFVSAVLHEWILILIFKIGRPIMTAFMLQQIPLIYLTKHMKNTRGGNLLVWWGLILGTPLILVSYLRCDPYVTKWFYQEFN